MDSASDPVSKRKRSILLVGLILLFLVASLFVISNEIKKQQELRSRAAEHKQLDQTLGSAVTEELSSEVVVAKPSADTIVVTPFDITVTVAEAFPVQFVEFWKNNDKEPFSVDYEAPFEVLVDDFRPGKHVIYAKGYDSEANIKTSEEVSFQVRPGQSIQQFIERLQKQNENQ